MCGMGGRGAPNWGNGSGCSVLYGFSGGGYCSLNLGIKINTRNPSKSNSSGSSGSDAVTVQSRYSWIVAARGASARLVPGRGGGCCPSSNALNRKGSSSRASLRPSVGLG